MYVEPLEPHHDPDLAGRLLAVQQRAYAVEARLIGDDRIPALHESIDDLLQAELTWLGVRDSAGLIMAAIGIRETAEDVDIDRLVVDPDALRRGFGRALVTAVQRHAGSRAVEVSTGRDNRPATALYESLGFTRIGDDEVLPGLWVTRYTWEMEAMTGAAL